MTALRITIAILSAPTVALAFVVAFSIVQVGGGVSADPAVTYAEPLLQALLLVSVVFGAVVLLAALGFAGWFLWALGGADRREQSAMRE